MLFNEQVVSGSVYSFDLVSSGDKRHCTTEDADRCHIRVWSQPWTNTTKVMWGRGTTCKPMDNFCDCDEEWCHRCNDGCEDEKSDDCVEHRQEKCLKCEALACTCMPGCPHGASQWCQDNVYNIIPHNKEAEEGSG